MALLVIIFIGFILNYGEFYIFNSTYNTTLYNVVAYNDRDRAMLYNFYMTHQRIFFYNAVTNQAAIPMKIIVEEYNRKMFEEILKGRFIQYSYISKRYWTKFMTEKGEQQVIDTSRNFHTYAAIRKWVKTKTEMFPHQVEIKDLSKQTYEKRKILTVKIGEPSLRKTKVYIIGGENARDWMSTAVIVNIMNNFIESLKQQQRREADDYRTLLNFYNMYFVPVLNPDGYVYNMESNLDRLWAKNRRTFFKGICIGGSDAVGVNIDRNWETASLSTTDIECKGVYLGPTSLSESETLGLFQRLNFNAPKIMAIIIVKGFGKMITIPYAAGAPKSRPVSHDMMMQILPVVADKLRKKFNESFFYGTTSTYLYNYSGNLADFMKNKLNIPLIFTVYLQRQDRFLPDSDDIDILTREFNVILRDVLLLAKDIYGPLFNCQETLQFRIKYVLSFIIIFQYCN